MHDEEVSTAEAREAWASVVSGAIPAEIGVTLPVLSGSMGPLIAAGCSMRVVSVPPEGTVTGDIVVFLDGHDLTAHRQLARVRIGRRCFIYQKGDRNPFGGWIAAERILGVVAEASAADGTPLYSRRGQSHQGRLEARRQLASMALRPLRKVKQAIGKLLAGRA